MAEYVNLRSLESALKIADSIAKANGKDKDRQIWARAIRLLNDMPTVDAVPVVRCKDCKHFKNYGKTSLLIDGKNIKAGWCHRRARYDEEYRMPPDGFCSYGERKEGAENG